MPTYDLPVDSVSISDGSFGCLMPFLFCGFQGKPRGTPAPCFFFWGGFSDSFKKRGHRPHVLRGDENLSAPGFGSIWLLMALGPFDPHLTQTRRSASTPRFFCLVFYCLSSFFSPPKPTRRQPAASVAARGALEAFNGGVPADEALHEARCRTGRGPWILGFVSF